MEKIMEFVGNKAIFELNGQDYAMMTNYLRKEYREIAITTQDDFKRAESAGCRIFMRTFKGEGYEGKKFFIRVPKEELFKVAEKC